MSKQVVHDLHRLKEIVKSGRCRVGYKNEKNLPCLIGVILETFSDKKRIDDVIHAVAEQIPNDESVFDRPQSRVMRYVRRHEVNRNTLNKIINRAIISSGGGTLPQRFIIWCQNSSKIEKTA